jgi:Phage Mu protein F like protein
MPTRRENEDRLFGVVSGALKRWLVKAKSAVMAPWRSARMLPDPVGVYQAQGDWDTEVDSIMTVIGQIAMSAWNEVSDLPPVSRHAFVMSQLAQTQNLLVRLPDEVYNLIFAELTDVLNGGGTVESAAQRIDEVLTYTDSERWPNRARVVAITETTRAYGAATVASGLEQSRLTGRRLYKRWDTEHDRRVRVSHKAADGQLVELSAPFMVGDFPLLFPGDPMGPPEEVINCRCEVVIVEGGR